MRNRYQRVSCVFHFIGQLLEILGLVLLLPLVITILYWGRYGEGFKTAEAFILPAVAAFIIGFALRRLLKPYTLDTTGSMLMCALGWVFASALGALPFVIGIGSGYLNAFFEAMSGFTTTGITVYWGLDEMPRSILFWRALTQWLGGLGILSFFLIVTFRASGAHQIFGAESHKISSGRPAPGLFNTLKILWQIYAGFTLLAAVVFCLEKMPIFDAVCHALTTLSTGGFSPHDASIEYYRLTGHTNYRLIEYTVSFFMMLGGINFLIHYRVLTRDFKALWDNIEVRYWWRLLTAFVVVIMIDHLLKIGAIQGIFTQSRAIEPSEVERTFRYSIFQVISVLTTTGFV
jgi:trk system potassium uptake protein TrkH